MEAGWRPCSVGVSVGDGVSGGVSVGHLTLGSKWSRDGLAHSKGTCRENVYRNLSRGLFNYSILENYHFEKICLWSVMG